MLAHASTTLHASPAEIFDILADPFLYPTIDGRITSVGVLASNHDHIALRVRALLLAPWVDSIILLRVRLARDREVQIESSAVSYPARLFLQQVKVHCDLEPADVGTRLSYTAAYHTKPNPAIGHLTHPGP